MGVVQENFNEINLLQVPLFARSRPSELQKLASHATLLHVEEGTCFDCQDDAIFIIRTGEWRALHHRSQDPNEAPKSHQISPLGHHLSASFLEKEEESVKVL